MLLGSVILLNKYGELTNCPDPYALSLEATSQYTGDLLLIKTALPFFITHVGVLLFPCYQLYMDEPTSNVI